MAKRRYRTHIQSERLSDLEFKESLWKLEYILNDKIHLSLWDVAKSELRGIFVALLANVRHEGK